MPGISSGPLRLCSLREITTHSGKGKTQPSDAVFGFSASRAPRSRVHEMRKSKDSQHDDEEASKDPEFDVAFPLLSQLLVQGNGQLAVHCGEGPHSYDECAYATLNACSSSPFLPSPLVIRVLHDGSALYPLGTLLCDLEACLAWMKSEDGPGAPVELWLCEPGSELWEGSRLVSDSFDVPPLLRGDRSSPMAALLPAAELEPHDYKVVRVPCSGTYLKFAAKMHLPRLGALVRVKAHAPHAPQTTERNRGDAQTAVDSSSSGSSGSSGSSSAMKPSVSRRASAPTLSPSYDGFVIGTAMVECGWATAALIRRGTMTKGVRKERMHFAAVAFASLELSLPTLRDSEPRFHETRCERLIAIDKLRTGASIPYPATFSSPMDLGFRSHVEPDDPDSYEKKRRLLLARLLAHEGFRESSLFYTFLAEAKVKRATQESGDLLDWTVLTPPTSFDKGSV